MYNVYKPYAHQCGTPYLAWTLSSMLLNHIREMLPSLRSETDELLKVTTAELAKYGGESSCDPDAAHLTTLLTAYSTAVADSVAGRYVDVPMTELYGGACISYIFHKKFIPSIDAFSPTRELTDDQISVAVHNSQGNRPVLFSQSAFEKLLQRGIHRLEEACMCCVKYVYEELVRIADQCFSRDDRYPNLRRRLLNVTVDLLDSSRPQAEEHLKATLGGGDIVHQYEPP